VASRGRCGGASAEGRIRISHPEEFANSISVSGYEANSFAKGCAQGNAGSKGVSGDEGHAVTSENEDALVEAMAASA
jgi:hypothetical protein